MIKRTPQEIADFTGCYVAQTATGYWFLSEEKPPLRSYGWITRDRYDLPDGFVNVPEGHSWDHLYEPQGKEGKTEEDFPYFTETADSDNKQDAYSGKQADSDNKEAPHQSQVHVHTEYCIVININPVGLSERVHELISEGWRPLGGVAVEHLPKSEGYVEECCYHQAMVRGSL